MTKSAMIKELIMQLLSDESPHTVSQMKNYLIQKDFNDYSEGQFSGSIDNLLKNKKIGKEWSIHEKMFCCFSYR